MVPTFPSSILYCLILVTFMMGVLQQLKEKSKSLNKLAKVTQLINIRSTLWTQVSYTPA